MGIKTTATIAATFALSLASVVLLNNKQESQATATPGVAEVTQGLAPPTLTESNLTTVASSTGEKSKHQKQPTNKTQQEIAKKQLDIIAVIASNFPLSEENTVEYNATTKNFLNQAYSALANQYIEGEFIEPDVDTLHQILIDRLPESAASDAATLVTNYFDYRKAELKLLEPELPTNQLESVLEQSKLLRRAYLGREIAHTLFNEEEMMASYIIQTRKVDENEALSGQEKKQLKDQLQIKYNLATKSYAKIND